MSNSNNVDYTLMSRMNKPQTKEMILSKLIGSVHLESFLYVIEMLRCINSDITIDITPEEIILSTTILEEVDDDEIILKETRRNITTSFEFCGDINNLENYEREFRDGVDNMYEAIAKLIDDVEND